MYHLFVFLLYLDSVGHLRLPDYAAFQRCALLSDQLRKQPKRYFGKVKNRLKRAAVEVRNLRTDLAHKRSNVFPLE